MSEKITLARPYAEAAFLLAQERGELGPWSEMLALAATIAADLRIVELTDDPWMTHEQFLKLFLDICGAALNQDGANFIRVLHERGRLVLLPEIAALYEQRRAVAENRIDVDVVSAFPVTAEQMQRISAALERRFGRQIDLKSRIDNSLIGGIIIRAGDLVIDGSASGRLRALGTHMNR